VVQIIDKPKVKQRIDSLGRHIDLNVIPIRYCLPKHLYYSNKLSILSHGIVSKKVK
jgi:hypothetical protein